jgi:tetraacyldisaccharide 4'-kinase
MIQFLKYLLLPFAVIYKCITSLRNLLFDLKIIPVFNPTLPTIGVGNLTVGGTGKTPIINYLISIIDNKKMGVVSRGYGRNTKGFIELSTKFTYKEVGDEPFMLFSKNPEVHFFVSESRVKGYRKAIETVPRLEVILFDDVFQHRHILPKINILLCDYTRPFFEDYLLPMGLLREARNGAQRADIILVTKCPEYISEQEKMKFKTAIQVYSKKMSPIFFVKFEAINPTSMEHVELQKHSKVVLISGLANNKGFREGIQTQFSLEKHFEFKDHHDYNSVEIEEILQKYPKSNFVCTEKDFVKIRPLLNQETIPFFYIANQKVVVDEEKLLKKHILDSL